VFQNVRRVADRCAQPCEPARLETSQSLPCGLVVSIAEVLDAQESHCLTPEGLESEGGHWTTEIVQRTDQAIGDHAVVVKLPMAREGVGA
jgi:hypothetical protein